MKTIPLFTSDLHLGDERQSILDRPFGNAHDCAAEIFHNLKVSICRNTCLYVVGDLSLNEKWLDRFEEATCVAKKRILIKGNYDNLPLKRYEQVFDIIEDSYIDISFNHNGSKKDFRMHHYPTRDAVSDKFSLCGHVHGAWKVQKNMLNLSVDVHHFRPIDAEKILFYYDAICKFYDQDVWAHEHPTNQHHARDRGQAGTYWEREFGGSHKG